MHTTVLHTCTGKAVCNPSGPHEGQVLLKSGQQFEGQDKQFTDSQEQLPRAVGERQISLGTRLSGAS